MARVSYSVFWPCETAIGKKSTVRPGGGEGESKPVSSPPLGMLFTHVNYVVLSYNVGRSCKLLSKIILRLGRKLCERQRYITFQYELAVAKSSISY